MHNKSGFSGDIDRINDVAKTLEDITGFYRDKGIKPAIYQSITDDGYFESIREELAAHGCDVYGEVNRYMVLLDECKIMPNPLIEVRKTEKWEWDALSYMLLQNIV